MPDPDEEKAEATAKGQKFQINENELRLVVMRMTEMAPKIATAEPHLARTIEAIASKVNEPGRISDPVFQTRIAYAFEDLEKRGNAPAVSKDLQLELLARATTYPGLQNDRMHELLQTNHALDNAKLVREVREIAAVVTRYPDQNAAFLKDSLDALEDRARLSPRITDRKDAPVAGLPAENAPQAPNNANTSNNSQSGGQQARVGMNGADNAREQTSAANRQMPIGPETVQAVGQPRSGRVVMDIMAALRRPEPDEPAPWDRQLTPMGDRISAYAKRMGEHSDEQNFQRAEKSGQAALTATREFADGPGTVLMTRIRDAARSDPQGITGVMAEMREGGRYAGLRQDFNVALQQEKGFAASYQKAASAVAAFGTDRVEVDKIAATRPDTAAIAGRFERLDGEIGKAASELPSKADGKSFTDELAERAREIVRKAAEVVSRIFNSMRASSGPSPS